jgi:hypothetical protein
MAASWQKYNKRAGRILIRDFRLHYFGKHRRLTKHRCEEFSAMMPISSRFREPSLLSPRTAEYVEAMIREGDSFDYSKWLKRVRQEAAQAKQDQTAIISRDIVAVRADNSINASNIRDARPRLGPALISKRGLNLRVLRRPHRQAKSQTRTARLTRWLEKAHRAWDEFQASRVRDAVYGYLEAVFAIVIRYKVRRRINRLLRHAFEFANLPFDKSADPFNAIIRCTCGNTVDAKTISKWSRALRFASRRKEPDARLKTFMKEAGGVNACAAAYAKG